MKQVYCHKIQTFPDICQCFPVKNDKCLWDPVVLSNGISRKDASAYGECNRGSLLLPCTTAFDSSMVIRPLHVHLSHAQTDQHTTVESSYTW